MEHNSVTVTPALDFQPPFLLKNPHVQTILAKSQPTPAGPMHAVAETQDIFVEADGETVHLRGTYAPQPNGSSNGLVLLLHGWLGCIESTYMCNRGEFFYQQGFSVFRLNMRDHGGTTALNEGLFHGCRIEEVFQAAQHIAALEPEKPFYVIGFSMGGSFALRIAWQHSSRPIPTLKQVVAVCPSIDPATVAKLIDSSLLYGRYFLKRWKQSLLEKQAAFPHLYNFDTMLALKTCDALTDVLLKKYSPFPGSAAYYAEYAFTPDKLRPVNIPATIIAASDDPVIPIASFEQLKGVNPYLNLHITPYGGHVGYVDGFPIRSWLDEAILALLNNHNA